MTFSHCIVARSALAQTPTAHFGYSLFGSKPLRTIEGVAFKTQLRRLTRVTRVESQARYPMSAVAYFWP